MDPGRSYLDNLQVAVLDENRIVTFKWLGAFLSSPSNEAKKMLYTFAKRNADKVSATYVVSGILSDNNFAVTLTTESKLETVKREFSKIVSVYVYSVQKQLPKDYNLISKPTRDHDLEQFASLRQDQSKMLVGPSLAAIRCADATRRSLEPRRAKAAPAPAPATSTTRKRPAPTPTKKSQPTKKIASEAVNEAASSQKEASPPKQAAKASKASTGLGSFFDKQRAAAAAAKSTTGGISRTKKSVFEAPVKKEGESSGAVKKEESDIGKKRARVEDEKPQKKTADIGAFWAKKAPSSGGDSSQEVLPSQPRKRIKRKAADRPSQDDSIFEDDDEKPLLNESQSILESSAEGSASLTDMPLDESLRSPSLSLTDMPLDESLGSPSLLDSSEEEEEEVADTDLSQEVLPSPMKKGALDNYVTKAPKKSGPAEVVKVHASPGASPGRVKVTKRKLVDGYYQFVDEWETVEGSGEEAKEEKQKKDEEERSQQEVRERAARAISKATGQASLTSFFKKKN